MERMQEGRGKVSSKSLRKLAYVPQHPTRMKCWRDSSADVEVVTNVVCP